MPKPADHYSSKQITEAIPEYFFIYNLKKEAITYLSDSFEKFRSLVSEETDLEQMRNLISADFYPVFDKIFKDINQHHYLQDKNLQLNLPNNEERWIKIKTYPTTSVHIELIAGHVQDVTERVMKLDRNKKEIDELEQIIHIMAHDLRGPLGSILNISEIQSNAIQEKDYKSAELYREMTSRIVKELTGTLKEMTDMMELKSDRFRLQRSTVKIDCFLRSLVEQYEINMKNKNIEFSISIPDNDVYAEMDPVKFRLVIQNLLTNAIKFTEEGGKITLCVMEDGNDVIFSVSDTGIGISENQHEHIFEKFTKMRRKGTKGEKSTGLGLSIAKKIIEVHQGSIEVNSKAGRGTSFLVRIPKKLTANTAGSEADDAPSKVNSLNRSPSERKA
ncbi:MAG: sensor histidine kinase [Candidatus Cyclobacteriaceae bacterium M2_1C_046]